MTSQGSAAWSAVATTGQHDGRHQHGAAEKRHPQKRSGANHVAVGSFGMPDLLKTPF